MTYIVKIEKRINTKDINEIHSLLKWGNYRPDQWPVVKKQSTFMVSVLMEEKQLALLDV